MEFAEGHKYRQYSAIQIQLNDIQLNLGCQRCHSLSMTTAFFFFPIQTFFKGKISFDLVSY